MDKGLLLFFLCALILACDKPVEKGSELEIHSRTVLENLPSASGIEILGDRIFVISDNTSLLYELNDKYQLIDSFSIASMPVQASGTMNKEIKLDFEGIASFERNGVPNILIFGSGSKAEARNKLVWLKLDSSLHPKVFDLSGFYSYIAEETNIGKKNLNLEGVSILEGKLFLFNRGNNNIWEFSLNDFITYVEEDKAYPTFKAYSIQLPSFNNVQSSFSGASHLQDESRIVFTASMEDTDNWVDDGEVFGSYIGFIDLSELADDYSPATFPLLSEKKMLKLKAESVTVKSRKANRYQLLLVTDSDGGNSELLEASFGLD